MKTINSKNKHYSPKVEIFVEPNNSKYSGFAGSVKIYDTEVHVDTRDGTGYNEVIEKLNPLVCKFALKFHFAGNTFEDTKHDVIIHILEGIPKYDPRKNMKLSSFLQMYIDRRLINKIRNKSRASRNATFLNIRTYNITCDCGCNFVETVGKNETKHCPGCNKLIKNITKNIPINMFELPESMLVTFEEDGESDKYINMQESIISDEITPIDDEVLGACDMQKWFQDEDPRVVKIVELMCFHDYSLTAAAKEVGLSGTGAGMKLRNLKDKKIVRELLGR